jgi:hypothetical protein
LINNNRQSGRRRGRGGQRQQGGNPSGNNGNRIDNRARGNANQLYEKYKTLAADAQRQGDRVNTEYYLQFADHYFRVLAESRSRFEEQNPNQTQNRGRQDAFDDEDEGFDEDGNEVTAEAEQPRRQPQQRDDRGGQDRGNRNNGQDRNGTGRDRGNRIVGTGTGPFNGHLEDDEPVAVEASEEREEERQPQPQAQPARAPRQRRAPRAESRPVEASEGETIDASALPPSLGFSLGTEADVEEVAPRPRRRTRRPANETTDTADAAE